MVKLLHQEITGVIIGAYYEVYNHTSRTLPEYIYERAMMTELRRRGLSTLCQDEYQIFYKDHLVGVQRLDLFVVQEVVIENKVAECLLPVHKAQGMSYLKTVGKSVGLLFNFGGLKPEFDRLLFEPRSSHQPKNDQQMSIPSATWLHPDLVYAVAGGLYEVHSVLGPGFVHRIYANACHQELRLRGIAVKASKRMQIAYKGAILGDVAFGHCW